MSPPIAMVSGGFDPLHHGHLDLLDAAFRCGIVVVALNSDAWVFRKKGWVLMPYDHRARILESLRVVTGVEPVDDADGTVCEALRRIRPSVFCNGGDRKNADPLEAAVCRELGIRQLFGVGGAKVASSSNLVAAVR